MFYYLVVIVDMRKTSDDDYMTFEIPGFETKLEGDDLREFFISLSKRFPDSYIAYSLIADNYRDYERANEVLEQASAGQEVELEPSWRLQEIPRLDQLEDKNFDIKDFIRQERENKKRPAQAKGKEMYWFQLL